MCFDWEVVSLKPAELFSFVLSFSVNVQQNTSPAVCVASEQAQRASIIVIYYEKRLAEESIHYRNV